ncbi:kinase-like protein [Lophium mytilinum]|uniref:non-specific serine/threonine protein kinase n=1 Tax=Lophium mytilinum TaxID=390894 RepID=A0A6A6R7W8_9PEZI|nr:kinase-like protein [Lophium mytilinum]
MSFPTEQKITGREVTAYYRPVRTVGSGTDGIVILYQRHKYEYRDNPRQVAAKVSRDAGGMGAIMREARMLRKLAADCLHIVRFLGEVHKFPSPRNHTILLEYCTLGDLLHYKSTISVEGVVPEVFIWNAFAQLSKALDYLHNGPARCSGWTPIAHCDIKAANILLCPGTHYTPLLPDASPVVKLTDFARAKEIPKGEKTGVYGTWLYLPPEKPDITPCGDVWAIGGIVHWLALDAPPVDYVQHAKMYVNRHTYCGNKDRMFEEVPCRVFPIHLSREAWLQEFETTTGTAILPYQPIHSHAYSSELNKWMTKALEYDPSRRITAKQLVEAMVPIGEREIEDYNRQHFPLRYTKGRESNVRTLE